MWTNKSINLLPSSPFSLPTWAQQNRHLYRWMAVPQWLWTKRRCWRRTEGPSFKSSTDNTLVNYRDCSPRLSNTWVELHWVSLKLHYAVPSGGHFAQWVLSGRAACEYRVFGGERDVGILQPSTTSPHLVVVLKETKLYLPYRKFRVLF